MVQGTLRISKARDFIKKPFLSFELLFLIALYFQHFRGVKFLIIQTAFIGDVILATGVLEKIQQNYPGSEIDFLLRKGNEGLLQGHPYLHRLWIWDKKKNKLPNLFRLLRQFRSEHYDHIINLHRFASSGILTAFSGAKHSYGFKKNPLSFFFEKSFPHPIGKKGQPYLHETERNHALVRDLTDPQPALPRLYPSAKDEESISSYQTRPYVCIAPASVWFTKQWPEDKWVELVQQLPADLNIYLLGAPSDKELGNRIREKSGRPNTRVLCGELSFLQSAALMRSAIMNYVNDSAPLHLATAVNAPVTAVFCSTIPEFGFGPLGDLSFIVETHENLSCRPCGLHGHKHCPQGHFRCANTITVKAVLESIKHLH
ncbi:MAG: glycosyltransferase family 9 protein [Terrimonas sp.]|nr:glycosyltransferase family 9 protein [Terrimonas sp.]